MTELPGRSARMLAGIFGVALAGCSMGPTPEAYRRALRSAAGESSLDCGLVEWRTDPADAIRCAQSALHAQRPFHVAFGVKGVEADAYRGLAVDAVGNSTLVLWDGDYWAGNGGPFRRPRISEYSCPSPSVHDRGLFIQCSP